MKRFLISYWVEENDCATDKEVVIEAQSCIDALVEFQEKIRLGRKVFKVELIQSKEK